MFLHLGVYLNGRCFYHTDSKNQILKHDARYIYKITGGLMVSIQSFLLAWLQ